MTSSPTGSKAVEARDRALVSSIEPTDGGTWLGSGRNGRHRTVFVPAAPDRAGARRWLAAMRRIDHIHVVAAGGTISCTVDAVGHRLPSTRPISAPVALGLWLRGVPMTVTEVNR